MYKNPRAGKLESQKCPVALLGSELDYLAEVLDFFKIPFEINPNSRKHYDLAILHHEDDPALKEQGYPILCVPSNTEEFFEFLGTMKVHGKCVSKPLEISLRIRKEARITFTVSRLFRLRGPIDVIASSKGVPLLSHIRGTRVNLLSVDLVDEIKRVFSQGMDLKPSSFFRFYTLFHIDSLVPRRLGDMLLRWFTRLDVSLDEFKSHINSLDGLRYLLLASAIVSAQKPFKILAFWKGGAKYAFTITHDVDTKYGLEVGIGKLRDVERKYGVKSAWNIPTGRYQVKSKALEALVSEGCEIGSHGSLHSGRLILHKENELVEVLRDCKVTLEKIGDCEVNGFRSPLLQHSWRILRAIARAGFFYDSSLPAWEIYCRTTGESHGIGTVYPLSVRGVTELPVTMPQDHQLLQLAGLKPNDVLDLWKALRDHLKSLGGFCNLVIHPDEGLFGDSSLISYYDQLIQEVTSDKECWLALPSEVARHWAFRSSLKVMDEQIEAQSGASSVDEDNVERMFVFHTYAPNDFDFD